MKKSKVLILGANGQIGTVLSKTLKNIYGSSAVISSDIRPSQTNDGPFELINVLDRNRIDEVIEKYHVNQIYHLAAILSANGEKAPLKTWDINMNGLFNVLEAARKYNINKVFYPSSIAVFGPNVPADQTPQESSLIPTTVYGMSKLAGENWANYYFNRYGLDVRSLRYPGIIGYQSMPGGGTTDYAVDIYHEAIKKGKYNCFLKEDTALPMIYMDDAIRATLELMEADADKISIRTSYNLSGMSFTPKEIAEEIQKVQPDFEISYSPDFRQEIADSWPNSLDDSAARNDWGWSEKYNLSSMTIDMLEKLKEKYRQEDSLIH